MVLKRSHNPFKTKITGPQPVPVPSINLIISVLALTAGAALVFLVVQIHARYTISLQSPIRLHFQWPLVIAERTKTSDAVQAQFDQHRPLSAYQQYVCRKFGSACRVALAIQRAENPQGKCEIYHYNTDGTLDWGYFQINTVHLKRRGLNLRDLLDCKANIDFAYQLYAERQSFTPWSTYNNGAYRRFLR
ncbi:MAG: hypothetical protein JO182_20460 [Acidobacteriaceae bacterium]|nr:hypothetical protein [Acidobacteriaceae bacterium]MBV9036875.1 hypothetical protein [Acidobacteriaceae bacterium]MBV9225119.1 hypothetical protein [Acidobacteriaceae bacterium]MBV9309012.1 hypothetical protein [Acidobacteriaceae bacterium]MBV9938535.1 hypothetical protein [Acidobacteriaceae bacterium]